jgi:putative oxidoreductase
VTSAIEERLAARGHDEVVVLSQAIDAQGVVVEQGAALLGGETGGDSIEGVPERIVVAVQLVDREVGSVNQGGRGMAIAERREAADAVLLVGRLCLAAIFLWSGVGKIGGFGGFVGNLASQGLPLPTLAALLGIALEAGGAALVMLGLFTRLAAAGLILFTIAATLIAHDFWTLEGPERSMQQIQFMKNLGLIGGFLLLIGSGAGSFSLDAARGRTRAVSGGRSV